MNGTLDTMQIPMYLKHAPTMIIRYVGISFYVFGLIGAFMNMYVFLHPAIRANSCCLFLLALSIIDLVQIHNGLLVRIAQSGFHWDPIIFSPWICKMRYYIAYIFTTDFAILVTLAAFERYNSTCQRRSQWHCLKKPAIVCKIIFSCILITCLVCLFVFFSYDVNNASICAVYKGFWTSFTMIYTFIVAGLAPPFFTILFACLTLRNLCILHRRSRFGPISYKTYLRIKEVNEQLTSMLFMQVVAMLVTSLPYACFVIYHLSVRHIQKTPLQVAWEKLIGEIIHLLFYVNYVFSAYINLTTSSVYRHYLTSKRTTTTTRLKFVVEGITSALLSLSRAEK